MNYYPTSGYTAFCPSAPEARVPIIPDYPQHGYGREAEWGRNQVYPRDYANSSAGANQSSTVPFIPPEHTPEERGQGLHGASRYPHFYPQESYSPYSQTREPPVIPPYTWSDDQSSTDDDSESDTGVAWDEASVVCADCGTPPGHVHFWRCVYWIRQANRTTEGSRRKEERSNAQRPTRETRARRTAPCSRRDHDWGVGVSSGKCQGTECRVFLRENQLHHSCRICGRKECVRCHIES